MQPKFVVPSRITIARDVMQLYLEERKNLKAIFASSKQRVCLTTDTWSSIQNINYMALTAHYVDSEWKLQKRILNFVQVANHKGETIGKMIEACLLEWGIERVFTVTVDNASSNDVAIAYMKKKLKTWKTAIRDGEFLHMRCYAHIINLVVSDGLKELDNSIVAIRNCVRYVRSSPSRLVKFNNCVGQERIENGGSVILDVPTRWNSTYLMLESALNFKRAFERMEDEDGHYVNYFHENENGKRRVGPPKEEDWVKADRYMEFLKLFYQVTLKFSASLHVTSNVYFHELCLVHTHIMSRIRSKDKLLSEMAKGMKAKYDKYWGKPKKVNALLFIAVVLDPRFKMRYVKWCFQDIYDDHVDVMIIRNLVQKVKDDFNRLFEFYRAMDGSDCEGQNNTSGGVDSMSEHAGSIDDPMIARYKRHLQEEETFDRQSKVDKYLLEAAEPVDAAEFDVLGWWKVNSSKYPILSQIARDVLAVPVSTVASESAFSTSGRILDSFRSSLTRKTVQALICAQNWLRSTPAPIDLQSSMEDVKTFEELEKEFSNLKIATPTVE